MSEPTREEQLDFALRRVLEWPLPNGTVETGALPAWLARIARDALAGNLRDLDAHRPIGEPA